MYRPLLYLTAVLAASLQAQAPLGPAPGRAFHLIQQSQWIPPGVDPSVATVADSGLIAVPTEAASKNPGKGLVDFRIMSPDYGVGAEIRISRVSPGHGVIITSQDVNRFAYAADNIGSTLFDLPAWFGRLPITRNGRWTDSLIYETVIPGQEEDEYLDATLPDTAWIRRVRHGRIERPGAAGWVWVRAETDVSLTTTSRPDYDDDPLEVRRLDILLGRWQERFLYDSANGQVDSVTVTGRLAVLKEFTHADGRSDTVTGEMVIERTGRWESDGTEEADRRNAVFIIHGRDPAQTKPGPEPPYWSYQERLREGDTTAFEELLGLRTLAGSAEKRREIERLLSYGSYRVAGHAQRRFLELWRPGDPFLTEQLVNKYRADGTVINARHAGILIRTFGTLAAQRTFSGSRSEGLENLMETILRADSVTRDAGREFAQAANATDDRIVAKIFLLAAYRADPAGFVTRVEALDTTESIGRQVVAYAKADPNRPYSSGGNSDLRDAAGFPGLDAPASAHAAYMEAARLLPDHSVFARSDWRRGMFREWIAAHEPNGVEKLRGRFARDTAYFDKSVWAIYLLQLGDTLPLPWLRTLARVDDDSARARAYWVLELSPQLVRDTLRDETLLADLQNRLLHYATTGLGFDDSTELRPFSSHDERPDQRILNTETLVSAILEDPHWQHRFEMLSTDSIQARAHREGLVMAFGITPVGRILDRYYVDVNHVPYSRYGGGCLCGGGSNFVLEFRHGKWRVVSMGQWVS